MALSTSCCAALASTVPNVPLAYPNSTSYLATQHAYWSAEAASLEPSCIAKPTCASDVSRIVQMLAQQDCKFAIKGQGHSPAAGFANIDHAVTIDMTGMDVVAVNGDRSVASVQAGASWLDVYAFLDPLNRTVAGGRNGAVGVGGLTLGGGISYFSPQVGWTCDTVVNFEVVLGNGEVVEANASVRPDLFRALKGGANNLGVVTRFDFATLPIGQILAGSVVNDVGYRAKVFDALVGIAEACEYDVHASIVTSLAYSSTSNAWTLSSTPIYTKPETYPEVYRELFAVPNITNTMHLTSLHTLANETATPQLNFLFYTGTYGVSSKLLIQFFDIANSTLTNLPTGTTWLLTFEPLPTIIVKRGVGKNILGTSPADGNAFVLLLTAVWPDAADTPVVQSRAAALMEKIDAAAKEMDMLHRYQYANYANQGQTPLSSYGSANEAFLKETAKKYDPKGVFQKLVPGGFKLGGNP